ncbi:MAG TPA: aspartate aminotransferase family protein [Candidatus Acidoferrales bacterium]|nr:aspartate aminotransferase family protein [Candidatus Acidoferrales bacterium]
MSEALLGNYNRAPVTFVRGEGCYLYDDAGNRYLDFIAGIAVCALGHCHPWISQAIAEQGRTLVHASNLYHHEPAATLARELVARSGLARAFFCNSGTEANEAAIKLARKRAWRKGEKERITILACTGSFHGRTYGALAATANDHYKEGFGPMPEGFAFTPFNDVAALEKAINDRTAAFIVEPVQGESGVHPASDEFLAAARRLCDRHGALLIFDEIQCGMGRLGPLFAFQRFGVTPDVVTMAKALANGLPIGAMLVAECAIDALQPGDHGSTFGGSPVPCAAGLAHLRVRDAIDLASYVAVREVQFTARLADLAIAFPNVIAGLRGMGLLQALPLNERYKAADVVTALRERGLLVGTAGGNTLRFAPPLIVGEENIDEAYEALYEVFSQIDENARAVTA